MKKIAIYLLFSTFVVAVVCVPTVNQSDNVGASLPYNEQFTLACHNCYEPQYADSLEEALAYTHTLEIDVWDTEIGSGILSNGKRLEKDWYVKHSPLQKGNYNCCGGSLRACLKRLRVWSDKHPNHSVVTLFIDKEENWSEADESRKPADFDQMLLEIFPATAIYTPAQWLQKQGPPPITQPYKWENLDSLKGKFLFFITDANAKFNTTGRKPLAEYLTARKKQALCFIAPEITQLPSPLNKGESSKTLPFRFIKHSRNEAKEDTFPIICYN